MGAHYLEIAKTRAIDSNISQLFCARTPTLLCAIANGPLVMLVFFSVTICQIKVVNNRQLYNCLVLSTINIMHFDIHVQSSRVFICLSYRKLMGLNTSGIVSHVPVTTLALEAMCQFQHWHCRPCTSLNIGIAGHLLVSTSAMPAMYQS